MTENTILIVEDSPGLAKMYEEWLEGRYNVVIAPDGETAIDLFEESMDVVLLDRRLPGASGDDVLEYMRERSDCPVAMVTAVDPDFDILEMGIDEYIVKPVDRASFEATVDRLLARSTYADRLREYFSLVSKRTVLAEHKTYAELDRSEYRDLEREIDELEQELADCLSQLEPQDFDALFRDIDADTPGGPASEPTPQ